MRTRTTSLQSLRNLALYIAELTADLISSCAIADPACIAMLEDELLSSISAVQYEAYKMGLGLISYRHEPLPLQEEI